MHASQNRHRRWVALVALAAVTAACDVPTSYESGVIGVDRYGDVRGGVRFAVQRPDGSAWEAELDARGARLRMRGGTIELRPRPGDEAFTYRRASYRNGRPDLRLRFPDGSQAWWRGDTLRVDDRTLEFERGVRRVVHADGRVENVDAEGGS